MKNILICLEACILIMLVYSCKNKNETRTLLAERIEYDVPVINYDIEQNWWVQNIEGSKRDAFAKKLSDALLSGKLKAYDIKTDELLSNDKIHGFINTGSEGMKFTPSLFSKLRFLEKWYIYTKTLEIEKKVLSICPIILKDSMYIPLFRIKFDTSVVDENAKLISERIQYDVNITNEQIITNNKQQKEWWIESLETSKRDLFIDLLINAAYSGKYKLFDYFNEPLSSENFRKEHNRNDTVTLTRPSPPYDIYDTVIRLQLEKNQIERIRFMEEWFWGDESMTFTKKVKGINPIIKRYKQDGDFKGYMPLFWLYFDQRYPIKS
jgi:hypothetical protein